MASAISPVLRERLRADLCRLARFGANISDSYSCFIFIPTRLLGSSRPVVQGGKGGAGHASELLQIGGVHSLSNDLVLDHQPAPGAGLIGWTATHRRSIHVSPFDRDSRTLGVYATDQKLKSFIAIPVEIEAPGETSPSTGVIACDSKKSFAFSKLQGKLLEDLSREVASSISTLLELAKAEQTDTSWQSFLRSAREVVETLGRNSVEILRINLFDYADYEAAVGSTSAIVNMQRATALIDQLLPAHVPTYRMPDGSFIGVFDAMMSGYYENRIRAVCDHAFLSGGSSIGSNNRDRNRDITASPNLEFRRVSFRDRGARNLSLEELVTTAIRSAAKTEINEINRYEYRRA